MAEANSDIPTGNNNNVRKDKLVNQEGELCVLFFISSPTIETDNLFVFIF
ncbi:hypothetical protein VII00023_10105 [Vibrio ichthyoenteri ATCC 700023]|uniref:Uncharacterized protein n=1 Tax=Vibrio ichthyoenteri ATCC 700023 TaxID=870968 RepID=F9RWC8_9VIBR|nr:hypothetical protein VII00023_10105 [Vibrio ichthyoenteri ATCC 700023]